MALIKIKCDRCKGVGRIRSEPAQRAEDARQQHSCGARCSTCAAGQMGDYALTHGARATQMCPDCGGKGYLEREGFEGRRP